ncbi:hypothetical protein BGZ81_005336 [Podila clonocystis]|nr:hypothetical protein BGZ81_005336 [Podila clonocystis]
MHNHELERRFASLVQQQKSSALIKLVVNVPVSSSLLLQIVTVDLPLLQHLEVRDAGPKLDLKVMLENLSECVKTVFVAAQQIRRPGGGNNVSNSAQPSNARGSVVKRHHSLEALHLVGDLNGIEELVLLPFLESCSSTLRVFSRSMRATCFRNKNISAVLTKLGSAEFDDLPQESNSHDRNITDVISLSAKWTDLSKLGQGGVGLWTMAAFWTTISGWSGLVSDAGPRLRARMCKCIRNDPSTLIVMAADLVGSVWATTSLRVLAMRIDLGQGYSEQNSQASLAEDNTAATPFDFYHLQQQLFLRIGA